MLLLAAVIVVCAGALALVLLAARAFISVVLPDDND